MIRPAPGAAVRELVTRPLRDAFRGLDLVLGGSAPRLARVAFGLLAGWWLYVPLHELLHAAGCWAAGGQVSRLEIAPAYGGAWIARAFPFVVAGGDYAGRLSGFDTGGSDLVYLVTDMTPFLLTLFPGVWALRWAARRRSPTVFGAMLPLALAPLVSLTGDAYEIGSIVVTRLPWWTATPPLRGDDVVLAMQELAAKPSPGGWIGLCLAQFLGLLWALATCALGSWLAQRAGQPALSAPLRDPHPQPLPGARTR